MLSKLKVEKILLDRSICAWGLRRFEILLEAKDPNNLILDLTSNEVNLIHACSNTKVLKSTSSLEGSNENKSGNELKVIRFTLTLFSEIFESGSEQRLSGFELTIFSERLIFKGNNLRLNQDDIISLPRVNKDSSLTALFKDLVLNNTGTANARPKILDIGGRARSGLSLKSEWSNWSDVTVLDIIDQPDVDVCGDAHMISNYFENNSFDAIISVSVFEHLAYPLKVVVESERVLKKGGYFLLHSHQTIGMHDLPWDFWRFSSSAYRALFCNETGFEVIETLMDGLMHITPFYYSQRFISHEAAAGFESSSVIARKIRDNCFDFSKINGESPKLNCNYPLK